MLTLQNNSKKQFYEFSDKYFSRDCYSRHSLVVIFTLDNEIKYIDVLIYKPTTRDWWNQITRTKSLQLLHIATFQHLSYI